MANSILEKVTVKNLKKTASVINKEAMNVSEDMVDGALIMGGEWTKIFEKAVKHGTVLFGKQQEMVLDTLEGVKDQYFTGTKRASKLVGFKPFAKRVKKARKDVVKQVKQTIDEVMDVAVKSEKVAKSKKVKSKKVAKKVTAKKSTAKKVVAKKAVRKATKVVASVADDLKKVNGIGPKMEIILNENGIKTYKQLASTKITVLKGILEAAGSRYRMLNPTTWATQAKTLAKK